MGGWGWGGEGRGVEGGKGPARGWMGVKLMVVVEDRLVYGEAFRGWEREPFLMHGGRAVSFLGLEMGEVNSSPPDMSFGSD